MPAQPPILRGRCELRRHATRVWLGGDLPAARPPPGPASLQSPAGEGLPLRGEEGRLQKTGPAGGQLSSPGVRGGVSGPGKGAQRLRDLEGHVAGRGGWAGPQSPRRSWAARSDAELEPGTLSRPLRPAPLWRSGTQRTEGPPLPWCQSRAWRGQAGQAGGLLGLRQGCVDHSPAGDAACEPGPERVGGGWPRTRGRGEGAARPHSQDGPWPTGPWCLPRPRLSGAGPAGKQLAWGWAGREPRAPPRGAPGWAQCGDNDCPPADSALWVWPP